MNEWDEIQKQNWGASQALPDPRLIADVLQQAIEKAISAHRDNHVIHVRLTIEAPNIKLTADLSYSPFQPAPEPQTLPQRRIREVGELYIGEEDINE